MVHLAHLICDGELVRVEHPETSAGDSYGEGGDDVGAGQPPLDLLAIRDDMGGRDGVWLGGVVRLLRVHGSVLTLLAGVPPL